MSTNSGVPKVKTLGILAEAGSVSTDQYQRALAAAGCPGTRFRAHRLLNRFLAQGLVSRELDSRPVSYVLAGEKIKRQQPFYRWSITRKGRERLAWLRKHGSKAKTGATSRRSG